MRATFPDPPPANCEEHGKLKLHTYEQRHSGTLCAKAWRGRAQRPFAHHSFHNAEQREQWLVAMRRDEDRRLQYDEERKVERAAKTEEQRKLLVPGALLSYSWGYDQTNVEFFQVTRASKSSVWIRPIACKSVEATGWASDRVVPDPDQFIGPEVRKRIGPYGLSMAHGTAMLCGKDRGHHRSWYA